jgi:hypothetical protein
MALSCLGGAITEAFPPPMLEGHDRALSVRLEADLDLGGRLLPIVGLPGEHEACGRLVDEH